MIVNALFQFGLGITIINTNSNQEIMVKKEMIFSFLSYGIRSDTTERWNNFQSEVSDLCSTDHKDLIHKKKKIISRYKQSPRLRWLNGIIFKWRPNTKKVNI